MLTHIVVSFLKEPATLFYVGSKCEGLTVEAALPWVYPTEVQ